MLSAGQGKRLLPLTEENPKCLLAVRGDEPILGWQLAALARAGIDRAVVVIGFGAERVEAWLAANPVPGIACETLFNPFYKTTDNLISCWLARGVMSEDFVLLNGDTIFEDAVLARVLDAPPAPITLAIDRKLDYDADDMKVSIDPRGRLLAVDKWIARPMIGGESIGLISFRGSGPKQFSSALEDAVRQPEAMRQWYLSVLHQIAQTSAVETVSVRGLWWREIDSPADLDGARSEFTARFAFAR
ncbi:MAG: phosphocholine cytidylyltransferase family protein [Deltaproteobacteria bacterium]|nr:MAG: phosphocholine cytidylyltransferase family protein [Deltaproteobacteria bacterium]